MVHCAAYNCLNDSRKNKGISFYKFSTENQRRKQWLSNLQLEGFMVKDHCGVFQVDFESECCELSPELLKSLGLHTLEKLYRCRLKRDAIPTIFDRDSPKAKCQVKGKQTFSKTKTKGKVTAKFRARLSPEISPRLSQRKSLRAGLGQGRCGKKYGAFAKRLRIEVSCVV